VTYLGLTSEDLPEKTIIRAEVQIDGGQIYEPSLSQFVFGSQAIGAPSVRTGPLEDVYLALLTVPDEPGDPIVLRVIIQPLVIWLWIGGGVMAFGTILAGFPGKRRRPTDPVSLHRAPDDAHTSSTSDGAPRAGASDESSDRDPDAVPAGAP